MTKYVLDTSALRGIGGRQLEAARQAGVDVTISPLSFYELATHLHEDFGRQRGQVLKARLPRLLDDPFAEMAARAGCRAVVNPSRFEDRLVVPDLLAALEEADSLATFEGQIIVHPALGRMSLRDFVARLRGTLDQEERSYLGEVERLAQSIQEQRAVLAEDGIDIMQPSAATFRQLAYQAARTMTERLEGDGAPLSEEQQVAVFGTMFLRAGYVFERARRYITISPPDGPLAVDLNDMEDAAICLHVDVMAGDVLVTNDRGTLNAVRGPLAALAEADGFGEVGTCVIDAATFLAEIGGG